jgi:hypothetical protein
MCPLPQLVHMMFNGFSETSITIERLPVYYKQVRNTAAACGLHIWHHRHSVLVNSDAVAYSVAHNDAQ